MSHVGFPLRADARGRSAASDQPRYVRDLIEQVLLTAPGERVMRPDFGSGLNQLVFGANGPAAAVAVEMGLQGALNQWLGDLIEARRVEVESEDAELRVTVQYLLRATGETLVASFTGPGA